MSPSTRRSTLLASSLALLGLLMLAEGPTPVNAHIKMISPPPLRGENNPQYDYTGFDYSMTNPLLEDGSNFACKGYHTDVASGKSQAVQTIKAGQQFEVTLDGSATHGGGSCQFSLSYDGGNTFGVVHSVVGGCPLAKRYPFKIPDNVPAGKNVLLAWTWFNKVGNREMYMNCAAINIESSSTSSIELPSIFRANTFGGSCHTVEGDELVFPNPGASVVYGGKWAGQNPGEEALQVTSCSEDQTMANKFVTLRSNTGASSDGGSGAGGDDKGDIGNAPKPSVEEPAQVPEPTPTYTVQEPIKEPISTSAKVSLRPIRGNLAAPPSISTTSPPIEVKPTTTSSAFKLSSGRSNPKSSSKVTSSPAAIETPNLADKVCTGTGIKCSENGGSFYLCSSGQWVSMGLVAPGTICKDGKIGHASLQAKTGNVKDATTASFAASVVSCSPGKLVCSDDGNTFSLCNADGASLTNMGLVAPGTQCVDGKICPVKKTNKTRRHKPRRLNHSS